MKIYTKTGDKGQTSLIGGTRVPKHHLRVEAYGTVDELNAHIGLLRSYPISEQLIKELISIQELLFAIGAVLASDPERSKMSLYQLQESDLKFLEDAIDRMESELPALKHFILPGGDPAAAQCHIARCVCRRAERFVVHLGEISVVEPLVISYLNRLSDYLFVLSRYLTKAGGAPEIPWFPRG